MPGVSSCDDGGCVGNGGAGGGGDGSSSVDTLIIDRMTL